MEEKQSATMDTKDPGKLDFDAPLLSTRRPNCIISLELPRNTHSDTHIKVPFSWEKIPGKPKEAGNDFTDSWVPPPRPPPGWHPTLQKEHDFSTTDSWVPPPPRLPPGWHPPLQKEHDFSTDSWVPPPPPRPPPGWHPPLKIEPPPDQESEYDADYDDNFFDAIDAFSLYEAFDIMVERRNALGGLNLEPRGNESPNFIIQRFLSDAKALAVSSGGLDISKNFNDDSGVDFSRKWVPAMESGSPPKGCGLDVFFPWRMKNRPCGAKSPARVRSKDVKARCSSRQKKSSSCMNEI